MKKLLLLLFIGSMCYSQNPTRFMYGIAPANIVPYSPNAGVGINTTTPQAILDVVSTTSGILIPRMTTTQKNAIVSPTISMQLFDTTIQKFQYWNGSIWVNSDSSPQNLQSVTDVGNTTTNDIFVKDDISLPTTIATHFNYAFNVQDQNTGKGASINNLGELNLSSAFDRFGTLSRNPSQSTTSVNHLLPATAGTLALVSDIPDDSNLVHKTGNETIGGGKTFTDTATFDANTNLGYENNIKDWDTATRNLQLKSYSGGKKLSIGLDGKQAKLDGTNLTTGRNYLLPDMDGTLALTSDLNFVPITGTASGSPISGDLDLQNDARIKIYDSENDVTGYYGGINYQSDGLYYEIGNTVSDGFRFTFPSTSGGQLEFNAIGLTNQRTLTVKDVSGVLGVEENIYGFRGGSDYSANITNLDYPQKIYVDNKTGWAVYQDTAYTIGSPFSILTGVTSTLPNNAGTVINTQIPTGVTSYYNSATNKITPANNGDYYTTTIRFKATTTAPTAGYFDFGIDIGGALGVQFKETKIFAKGAGIEHNFSIVVPMYSGATFIANGGLVKITSGNGNMAVYDINYHVDLVHKAK